MTTLSVKIDKRSRQKYNLKGREISFETLRWRIISAEGLEFLRQASRVAMKTGLRKMSAKEIETEIRATRNAQNRS